MLIREIPRADPARTYPGHSARVAFVLTSVERVFRAAATVSLRREPDDQWSRNRTRLTASRRLSAPPSAPPSAAAAAVTLRLV